MSGRRLTGGSGHSNPFVNCRSTPEFTRAVDVRRQATLVDAPITPSDGCPHFSYVGQREANEVSVGLRSQVKGFTLLQLVDVAGDAADGCMGARYRVGIARGC